MLSVRQAISYWIKHLKITDTEEDQAIEPEKIVMFPIRSRPLETRADQMKFDFSGADIVDDLTDQARRKARKPSHLTVFVVSIAVMIVSLGLFTLMFWAQSRFTSGYPASTLAPNEIRYWGKVSATAFFLGCFAFLVGASLFGVSLNRFLERRE